MANDLNDDRAGWVQGYAWAARLMAISVETSLPAAGGYWLDGYFHTGPWLLIVGFFIGFIGGGIQLMRIIQARNGDEPRAKNSDLKGT